MFRVSTGPPLIADSHYLFHFFQFNSVQSLSCANWIVRCVKYLVLTEVLQFSHPVMSSSLRSHGLQHARLPCPSPSPGAHSNSCSLSRWGRLTTFSAVVPFFSCLQSFPASGSFPMSWLFTSGGWSTGASASVPPKNSQGWFPLGLTDLISLQS